MTLVARHVIELLKELIDEHTALNWDEISRGEMVIGDIVSQDGDAAADIEMVTDEGDCLRVDMSDGTAFLISVEPIVDTGEEVLANSNESSDVNEHGDDSDDEQRLPQASSAR